MALTGLARLSYSFRHPLRLMGGLLFRKMLSTFETHVLLLFRSTPLSLFPCLDSYSIFIFGLVAELVSVSSIVAGLKYNSLGSDR
jgi:hypothetical protein